MAEQTNPKHGEAAAGTDVDLLPGSPSDIESFLSEPAREPFLYLDCLLTIVETISSKEVHQLCNYFHLKHDVIEKLMRCPNPALEFVLRFRRMKIEECNTTCQLEEAFQNCKFDCLSDIMKQYGETMRKPVFKVKADHRLPKEETSQLTTFMQSNVTLFRKSRKFDIFFRKKYNVALNSLLKESIEFGLSISSAESLSSLCRDIKSGELGRELLEIFFSGEDHDDSEVLKRHRKDGMHLNISYDETNYSRVWKRLEEEFPRMNESSTPRDSQHGSFLSGAKTMIGKGLMWATGSYIHKHPLDSSLRKQRSGNDDTAQLQSAKGHIAETGETKIQSGKGATSQKFQKQANSNTYQKMADNTDTDQLLEKQSETDSSLRKQWSEKEDSVRLQSAKTHISETGETKVQSEIDETCQIVPEQENSSTYTNMPDYTDTDQLAEKQSETDSFLRKQWSEKDDSARLQSRKGHISETGETKVQSGIGETCQMVQVQDNSITYQNKADYTDTDQFTVKQSETDSYLCKKMSENDDTLQPAKGHISDTGETNFHRRIDETSQTVHDQASFSTNQNKPDYTDADRLGLKQSETEPYSTAIPLCLPNNLKWNQDARMIESAEGVESGSRGNVKICEEGIKLIESIGDDLVIIVCISGPARTGKSFLLSQFHESLSFEVGHSTVSHTTGIWVALSPEKIQVGQETARLIFLDAEGLDSVSTSDDGGNDDWERKVFSLCTLFSSYMIYNCQGVPRATDLDKLGVIAQFSEAIYYNTQESNMKQAEEEYLKVAPHFLWLIRDARLKPKVAGTECSWDTFIEESILTCKKHDGARDVVRKAIRRVFQSINAEALPTPVSDEGGFAKLSSINDEVDLKPQFLEGIAKIKASIVSDPKKKVKRIKGCYLNGYSIKDLLKLYVEEVNRETNKLHVENVSEVVVKSQLSSSMSKAMEEYNKPFKTIKLPLEAHELSNVHQKATVEAHSTFDKWTRRIDEKFTNVFKKELSQKINLLLDSFKKENTKASESHCVKIMEILQEDLKCNLQTNFQTYGCEDIRKAKDTFIKSYRTRAKGPMADEVRAKYEPQMTEMLRTYKARSFENAERNALKLYKDNKKIIGSVPFENDQINESHEKAQKTCLDALSIVYDQCSDCQKKRLSFCDELSRLLREHLTSNESVSQSFCERIVQELTRRHFDQAKKFVHSRSFRFFQEARDTVLKEYDQKAKGPAKDDVKIKCRRDLERQLDSIEVNVANSAFKNARELYKNDVEKVMKEGPYEVEKLKDKTETIRKHTFSSLTERCEGIRKMKLDEDTLLLERFMEDKNDYLFCQNILQSEKSCDEHCMDVVRKCDLKLSEFVTFAVSKKLDESLALINILNDTRKDLIRIYLEKAKGPMRDKVMERLNNLIDLKFVETQRLVLNDASGKATVRFDKLLEDLSKHGPHDEKELVENLKNAGNKVLFMFDDRSQNFETSCVTSARGNLQKVIDAMKNKCIYKNESQSFQHCESVMMKITKKHSEYWDMNIFTVDFDKAPALFDLFTTRKEDYIKEFKKDAKGPASNKFEQKCRIEIDRQIREFQTFLANSNLRTLISKFRKSISKNITENMPFENEELQKRKDEEKATLSRDFSSIYRMSEEEDAKTKLNQLETSADDILSKLDGMNYMASQNYCENILKEMLDTLGGECTALLKDCTDKPLSTKFYPMEELRKIKTNCLHYFEEMAKGPAKSEAQQKGSNEIDKRLLQIKRSIAKDALEKAVKIYHLKFSAIPNEELLNDIILNKIKNQSAVDVKKHFSERCKDSERVEAEDFENLLQKAISEINGKIDTRHANLSREFCETLAQTLSVRVEKSCQELIKMVQMQDSGQNIDVSVKIKEIETTHITQYNQNAKGIERPNVFKTYEITIQNKLQSAAREISKCYLTKALNSFKSNMRDFMATGPHEVENFSSQSETFTLDTKIFFQKRCKQFDKSIYASDEDTLISYLKTAKGDFQTENELQSLKFCSDILKDLLATRKKYKRKSLFIAAYNAKAKGPMVHEALSKFMDPIDTHYRSWYALFHRW